MNVSKLIVGLVVAGFSLASFALTMGDGEPVKKAAAASHLSKHQKEQKVKKAAKVKFIKGRDGQ